MVLGLQLVRLVSSDNDYYNWILIKSSNAKDLTIFTAFYFHHGFHQSRVSLSNIIIIYIFVHFIFQIINC